MGSSNSATYSITGGGLYLSGGGLSTELNITGGSTFNQTGGSVSLTDSGAVLSVAADSFNGTYTGSGTYLLNGGDLTCTQLQVGNTNVSSTAATFEWHSGNFSTSAVTLTNGGRFKCSPTGSSLSAPFPFTVNNGTIEVTASTTVMNISGNITGTGTSGFTKTGAGTLTLSGNNSVFNVSVSNGVLLLGSSTPLGSGGFVTGSRSR